VSNKFLFTITPGNREINIPIEMNWDFVGRTDSIEMYEDEVLENIIGVAEDFEILRFAHAPHGNNNKTEIFYEFYFYSGDNTTLGTSVPSDWATSYLSEGFTSDQIYYYRNPFTKSFFKLDFYDTRDSATQSNYFTIIIPVQQGFTETASISPSVPSVQIKKPIFKLDYVGDKEGFFIYWLANKNFLDLDTFYMTAKFFDARLGVFVKMMTTTQAAFNATTTTTTTPNPVPSPYLFNGADYFYHKVVLDYDTKTYQIFDLFDNRLTTIKWFEYVNP
jgi:hypothetical protein